MELNDISGVIVDRALMIHRRLGPGLMESVYQRILAYELRKAGLGVETEVPIPVEWDGHVIDDGFRIDILVDRRVIVELKSVETTLPVHRKQTLTYLKLAGLKLALLTSFGEPVLRKGIHRLVNKL